MRLVTEQEIIEIWNDSADLDHEQSQALVRNFGDEQPALMMFVYAQMTTADNPEAEDDLKDEGQPEDPAEAEEEAEVMSDTPLVEIVLAIWQALSKAAGKKLTTVTPEKLDEIDEKNMQDLEALQDASEADFEDTVKELMQSYNQREVLGFALEVLMSGYEDAPDLAPERIGLDLMSIKTVVDCLDQ